MSRERERDQERERSRRACLRLSRRQDFVATVDSPKQWMANSNTTPFYGACSVLSFFAYAGGYLADAKRFSSPRHGQIIVSCVLLCIFFQSTTTPFCFAHSSNVCLVSPFFFLSSWQTLQSR